MDFLKAVASAVGGLAIVAFSLGITVFLYGGIVMFALWWTAKVLGWMGV